MPRSRLVAAFLVWCACSGEPQERRPLADAAVDDAAGDARVPDAAPDAATLDAPAPDAQAPDAATPDAAVPDAAPPDADPCASPLVERWTGTASREQNDGYPDRVYAEVTWQRVASDGCVDHYEPTGIARYDYAVPGALCNQWIVPDTDPIAAGDATLTIDRTDAEASYTGRGASFWPVVWYCQFDDGTMETSSFEGGGTWFEASGRVAGGMISGTDEVGYDDPGADVRCGPTGIPPCTYTWSFTAE